MDSIAKNVCFGGKQNFEQALVLFVTMPILDLLNFSELQFLFFKSVR